MVHKEECICNYNKYDIFASLGMSEWESFYL